MTPEPGAVELPSGRDPSWVIYEEECVKAVWGEAPHRISHLTAMAMAPVAVKRGRIVDGSGPAVSAELAERHGVRAFAESADTLLVGALHRVGNTWISSPARGLLECLKARDEMFRGHYLAARTLQRGYWVRDALKPAKVTELAARLGWDRPLRRLASVAARMNYCRWVVGPEPTCVLPDGWRPLLDVPATDPDSDWICISPGSHPCGPDAVEFVDAKYRVRWCWEPPYVFIEQLFT